MLHDDLLQLARRTFELEPGSGCSREAHLRRAVSTAYFAIFHLLVHEATSRMNLHGPNAAKYQRALARAFQHETMKAASEAIAGTMVAVIDTVAVPSQLKDVALAFTKLLNGRHDADYNLLSTLINEDDTRLLIEQAEDAFRKWEAIRDDPVAALYLTLLTTYQSLKNRKQK